MGTWQSGTVVAVHDWKKKNKIPCIRMAEEKVAGLVLINDQQTCETRELRFSRARESISECQVWPSAQCSGAGARSCELTCQAQVSARYETRTGPWKRRKEGHTGSLMFICPGELSSGWIRMPRMVQKCAWIGWISLSMPVSERQRFLPSGPMTIAICVGIMESFFDRSSQPCGWTAYVLYCMSLGS